MVQIFLVRDGSHHKKRMNPRRASGIVLWIISSWLEILAHFHSFSTRFYFFTGMPVADNEVISNTVMGLYKTETFSGG